ncbi:hypothetical protein MJO28_011566 [Puccinia striiformis f. sp. tritici]|uniref:Uncharacterized protein n=1 Tax=Puccinia striiformis f. sp. tritici TaxID=168172 RepID=A0ACC0E2L6_9BASI|nr:hypothetical protein MJO28_011566 [Puccinia striiformis f. sp. tritici]
MDKDSVLPTTGKITFNEGLAPGEDASYIVAGDLFTPINQTLLGNGIGWQYAKSRSFCSQFLVPRSLSSLL